MARANSNGEDEAGEDTFRISLTIDRSILKKVRIAAAVADMDRGEWCAQILEKAADKAIPNMPRVRESA